MLGNLTYEYDKNGNRTKIGGSFARTGIPPSISSTAYNAANHQTTFGNSTLTYDNNGNVQTITDASGTTTYTWNARNQLMGISGPSMNAGFVYDGLGRRQKKTINGTLTEFLYDGSGVMLREKKLYYDNLAHGKLKGQILTYGFVLCYGY